MKQTQAAIEVARIAPPSSAVKQTQAAIENIYLRPNAIRSSQVCLEVLFPADSWPPEALSRRNHSFVGVWMGTGHADNASFSF